MGTLLSETAHSIECTHFPVLSLTPLPLLLSEIVSGNLLLHFLNHVLSVQVVHESVLHGSRRILPASLYNQQITHEYHSHKIITQKYLSSTSIPNHFELFLEQNPILELVETKISVHFKRQVSRNQVSFSSHYNFLTKTRS